MNLRRNKTDLRQSLKSNFEKGLKLVSLKNCDLKKTQGVKFVEGSVID